LNPDQYLILARIKWILVSHSILVSASIPAPFRSVPPLQVAGRVSLHARCRPLSFANHAEEKALDKLVAASGRLTGTTEWCVPGIADAGQGTPSLPIRRARGPRRARTGLAAEVDGAGPGVDGTGRGERPAGPPSPSRPFVRRRSLHLYRCMDGWFVAASQFKLALQCRGMILRARVMR
jgi:hypothetical protein